MGRVCSENQLRFWWFMAKIKCLLGKAPIGASSGSILKCFSKKHVALTAKKDFYRRGIVISLVTWKICV